MSRPTVVYIASPMTHGYWVTNFNRASDCAERLMVKGYSFFNPVPSYFHEIRHKHRSCEDWLRMDFGLILVSDCLLRIPGKSEGADREMDFAVRHDIPVFSTELELFKEMATTVEEPVVEQEEDWVEASDAQIEEILEPEEATNIAEEGIPICRKVEEIITKFNEPKIKEWKNERD